MKRFFFTIMTLLLCLAFFVACNHLTKTPETTEAEDLPLQTVDVSTYRAEGEYPQVDN